MILKNIDISEIPLGEFNLHSLFMSIDENYAKLLEKGLFSSNDLNLKSQDLTFIHETEHQLQIVTTPFGITNYIFLIQSYLQFYFVLLECRQNNSFNEFQLPLLKNMPNDIDDNWLFKMVKWINNYHQTLNAILAPPHLFSYIQPDSELPAMKELLCDDSKQLPYATDIINFFNPSIIACEFANGSNLLIPVLPNSFSENDFWFVGLRSIMETSATLTELNVMAVHVSWNEVLIYWEKLCDCARDDRKVYPYVACAILIGDFFQTKELYRIGYIHRMLCDLILYATIIPSLWFDITNKKEVKNIEPGFIYLALLCDLKANFEKGNIKPSECTHDTLYKFLNKYCENLFHNGNKLIKPLKGILYDNLSEIEKFQNWLANCEHLYDPFRKSINDIVQNIFKASINARLKHPSASAMAMNEIFDQITYPYYCVALKDGVHGDGSSKSVSATHVNATLNPLVEIVNDLIYYSAPTCPILRMAKKGMLHDALFACKKIRECSESMDWFYRKCSEGNKTISVARDFILGTKREPTP